MFASITATTFQWLPSEIDLGFAGTSALMTATLALAVVWPMRLLMFVTRTGRGHRAPRSARFGAMATLSSGAAALGAVLGLTFTIVGALFA